MIRREILPHALASEPLPQGRAWRFPASPALGAKLEHLVALERECCRDGVRFELTERRTELVLEVHGVDPNAEIFRPLEE